jgi:hypothetical protein
MDDQLAASPRRRTHPSVWFLVLALACASLFFAFRLRDRHPVLPPITVLPSTYANPPQDIPLFARIVPARPGWIWLWKLKEIFFGRMRSIQIEAQLLTLPPDPIPDLGAPDLKTNLAPGAVSFSIWRLQDTNLAALRQQLHKKPGVEFISSPRMSIGDGTEGSMYSGSTLVQNGVTLESGVHLTCAAQIRGNLTDLTTFVCYSELLTNSIESAVAPTAPSLSIRTNLDVKARFQIPGSGGIFLLQDSKNGTNRQVIGVILSTKK